MLLRFRFMDLHVKRLDTELEIEMTLGITCKHI